MLILLRDDLKKVGKAGEVVKVKDGYARNYLIPEGFAYPATDAFINIFEEEKKSTKYKEARQRRAANLVKKQLKGKTFTIVAKIGENGKMFGSVTSAEIADVISESGIEIDKKKLVLEETIKQLGLYTLEYKLHPEIPIEIDVRIQDAEGKIDILVDEDLESEEVLSATDSDETQEENLED